MAISNETKELSKGEQEKLGLPEGFRMMTSFPFDGMNQSDSRMGMDDKDLFYVENFTRLGNGNYRALWDVGASLYTAAGGKTIVSFFFYNIGPSNYVVVFLSDGTATQINSDTGATTVVSSTTNTFYNSGVSTQLPCCAQWGSTYLLIANNNTSNDYWVWDGADLHTAGTLQPGTILTSGGSGYGSPPTVVAYGGSGSGATFTASVVNGSVVNIQLTNPGSGYQLGDVVQLYISGGGSDSNAELTASLTAGAINAVIVTNIGSGYPAGTFALAITGGGGSGAIGTYTVGAGGTVTGTSITSGGSGYTSTPSVAFPTSIKSVTITNAGSGYTAGTYALGFSGGGGTGAAGTYTVDGTMTVVSTVITSGGSGYTSAPAVSFPSGGGSSAAGTAVLYGSGAAGIAKINAGAVTSVTVVHGGTGFTGTPTITFVGGGGSGAIATAVMSGGVISSVTVTNGGTGYTSTPAVEVQTGLNNAASANVSIMPFGVSGSSIETFQSRVWIAHPHQVISGNGIPQTGGQFNVSAPGSFSDFATSDGGLTYTSTDAYLKSLYTNMKQSNGYLYPFGDSSVSVISNVQTSAGSFASTTTFNYQNTDPQIGTSWRDSCSPYSRTILFGNPLGIFGLYGGSVTKVSQKVDQIFTAAVFPPTNGALLPSSAVANIYSKKIFMMLMTFTDPFTFVSVNKMVCWDEKDYFIASQSVNLIYIGTQEVSSQLKAWGTDGNSLYPLFNKASSVITKKMSTKLFGTADAVIKKRAYTFMFQGQDLSLAQSGISLNVNIDTNYLDPNTGSNSYPIPTPISISANQPTYPFVSTASGDVYGMNIGATITSTSSDFTVNFVGLGYINEVAEPSLNGG